MCHCDHKTEGMGSWENGCGEGGGGEVGRCSRDIGRGREEEVLLVGGGEGGQADRMEDLGGGLGRGRAGIVGWMYEPGVGNE